ncbi:MAG: FimV/HubP family polar landmark protein [Pseudomonadota bacterium]|nr:FimV/HubP family polar landmark protein [Pseudomonadota bacterium]
MKKLVWGVLPLIVFFPGAATSLGLGGIEVDSALNQPLRAEITLLSVHPDELEDITVRLASPEAFERVGIERPVILQKLQFKPTVLNGRAIIDVISREPIREPFLDFLVEIVWPNGRMIREYTILLDPPVLMERRAAVAPAAPVVRQRAPSPALSPAPRAASAKPVSPRPSAVTTRSGPAPDTYRVRRGDTLSGIVRQVNSSNRVSSQQMMIAMLRANPEAFTNNSIHNLKSGAVLRIPDAGQASAVSQPEAVAEVASQNALWREYHARAAGRQVQSQETLPEARDEPGAVVAIQPRDTGTRADGNLEILAASETGDEAGANAGAGDGAAVDAALAREIAESRLVENEALKSRVAELEAMVTQQEHVITLQNEELSVLQDRLVAEDLALEGGITVTGEDVAVELDPESSLMAGVDPGLDEAGELPLVDLDLATGEPGLEDPAVDELVSQALEPETAVEVTEADVSVSPLEVSAEEVAQPPAGLLDRMLSDDRILYGLGGGAVLLALIGLWMVSRRRRDADESDDMADLFATGARTLPSAAVAGGTTTAVRTGASQDSTRIGEAAAVGESVDETPEVDTFERTAQVMVTGQVGAGLLDTGAMQPGIETNEQAVDEVVSEADVYVAYGLFQQAEDLLKGAIENAPDTEIYRAKLAEAYFRDDNREAFVETAQEMAAAGQNQGEFWNRVVAMGQEISPEHALFAGADTGGLKAKDFLSNKPESTDLDMSADEAGPTGTQAIESGIPGDDFSADATDTEMFEMPAGQTAAIESVEDDDKPLDFDLEGLDFGEGDTEVRSESREASLDEGATLDFEISELNVSDDLGASMESGDATDLGVSGDLPGETAAFGELHEDDFDLTDDATTEDDNVVDLSGVTPEGDVSQEEIETELVEGLEGLEDLAAHFEEDIQTEHRGQETTQFDPADFETEIMGIGPEGDSVTTKLDLARAFIDMGDADGARSTLEEVVREGDDHQRHEAEELLKQIA